MVHEEDEIRERIQKIMHLEGLSQSNFASMIGRGQPNVSDILRGKIKITRTFTNCILKAFPDVRKEWLMFGEGSIYEHEDSQTNNFPTDTKPRLPRTLTEGHLQDYFEGKKRNLCQEKPIITQFPDYDFSLFLKTDRMAPNYRRGDELFFKKTAIKEWGSCYLLDTSEGPKFKKIYEDKDENGNPVIRCVSYDRENYPDFTIPKELIYGYYKCVGALRIL